MPPKIPLPTRYLNRVNHPELKAFDLQFRPAAHAFTWSTSRFLDPPFLPLASCAPYQLDRYAEYQKTPLWWGTIAQSGNVKRTVKSWVARRVRIAFTESLRKQGWDKEGKVLKNWQGVEREDFFGTAFFFASLDGVKIKPQELERQTDIAVLKMIQIAEDKRHNPKVKKWSPRVLASSKTT